MAKKCVYMGRGDAIYTFVYKEDIMLKKITSVCVAVCMTAFLLFNLTGCLVINAPKNIELSHDVSEITEVELYNFGIPGCLGRHDSMIDDNIDLMIEENDPIRTMDPEQYGDFVRDLEKITFTDEMIIVLASVNYSHAYEGFTVRIIYDNGDYDILSHSCQLYDSGDRYSEENWGCDMGDWNTFIRTYFDFN